MTITEETTTTAVLDRPGRGGGDADRALGRRTRPLRRLRGREHRARCARTASWRHRCRSSWAAAAPATPRPAPCCAGIGRACGATAVTLSMHYHLTCTQVWRHRHGQPAEAILRRIAAEDLLPRLHRRRRLAGLDRLGAGGRRRVPGARPARRRRAAPPPATCWSPRSAGTTRPTARRSSTARCRSPPTVSRWSATWDTLGLRGTGSETVVLDDVFVPDAAVSLVRPADLWHPVWSTVLGTALPLIMSAYLGIADRARRRGRAPGLGQGGASP